MRAMLKTHRGTQLVLAAAALACSLAGCKRTQQTATKAAPEQLELKPAAAARANLVAEIVLANLDRTLASAGAVAKKLGLPFSESDLKTMIVARTGAPEALVESIDRSKPIGVAVVLVSKKDGDAAAPREAAEPVVALALKTAGKAGFDAFAALAGKVVERSRDAVKVQPGDAGGPGSAVWLLSRDGAVCAAEELDRLVAGCTLALEARKAGAQDLRVSLLPEGMARASGTTLKEALAKARQELAAEQLKAQSAGGQNAQLQAHAGKLAEGMMAWVFDAIADTTEGRIALALDQTKGLTTTFEVVPRPGSPLAKTVANRHAYNVDPALVGGAPGALWAMGDMTFTRTIFDSMRAPLLELITPEAERAKAGAAIDGLFEALSGPFSARFGFEGGPKMSIAYDVIYGVKPGTDGKKLTADLESVMKAPWLAKLFDTAFEGMVKMSTKRDGAALVTQVVMNTKKIPTEARAQLKALPLFDGKPLEARTALAGEKMLVSIGPGTKARLAALASSAGAQPSAEVAAALAETKGDDAFYYTDLAATFRPVFALAASGALAPKGPEGMQATMMAGALGGALQNSQLATWGSYRGGETAAATWRIPMTTFESIGKIVAAVTGGMAGH
jgi:hypothetical protein